MQVAIVFIARMKMDNPIFILKRMFFLHKFSGFFFSSLSRPIIQQNVQHVRQNKFNGNWCLIFVLLDKPRQSHSVVLCLTYAFYTGRKRILFFLTMRTNAASIRTFIGITCSTYGFCLHHLLYGYFYRIQDRVDDLSRTGLFKKKRTLQLLHGNKMMTRRITLINGCIK